MYAPRSLRGWKIWPALFAFAAIVGAALPASAQLNQPFVFHSGAGVFVGIRNDTTGAITEVNGSPFPSKVSVDSAALDFKGRYLFAASSSSSNVSMFTVDANTGALQEVPTSPFASTVTNKPIFVATEITGQYVFVVNTVGPTANEISVEAFQIDTVNLALVPSSVLTVPGTFVAAANDPRGHAFYVYLNSADNPPIASLNGYAVNPTTGFLEQTTGGPLSDHARALVIDPQGTFLITGEGQNEGQLSFGSISPIDGTVTFVMTAVLSGGTYPVVLALDSAGKFLYATKTSDNPPIPIHLYSTALLKANSLAASAELPNSPLAIPTVTPNFWVPDPTGPFIYADKVYQVDAQTGILSIAQPVGSVGLGSAFSRPLLGQPVSGPVPMLNPQFLSFGSLTLGQTSNTQAIQILSTGEQALSLNSITVTGDVTDFPETDDCHAPTVLQPGKFCTVQIGFSPTIAGTRSASLTITDNGSPKTLSAPLTGTGLTPAPAVTLIPASLDFGTQTEGTTSQAQTVTLTNAGTAPLQISSVTLGGSNSNDFAMTNTCPGSIPVGGTCKISATFSPLAQGFRSTTISIADNAPNPTQTIALGGSGAAAVTPTGTTSQNVAAGQTAAYPLTFTAGAGFSGTVSLSCSGAPLGATCSVPASVQVTNGTPAPFNVTVKTSGPHAAALPYSTWPRFAPFNQWPMPYSLALLLMALLAFSNRSTQPRAKRLAWSGAFATIVLFAVFSVAGCGGAGGGTPPPPPPVVTPPGTFTLTVTPAATSPTGKPLQLSPIQLTLNVTQ